jgi:hypothetical protein
MVRVMVPACQVHYLVPFAVGRAQRLEAKPPTEHPMLGCYAPVRPGRGRQYRDGGADAAFDELAEKWGPRYPAVAGYGTTAWAGFIPFLHNAARRRIA